MAETNEGLKKTQLTQPNAQVQAPEHSTVGSQPAATLDTQAITARLVDTVTQQQETIPMKKVIYVQIEDEPMIAMLTQTILGNP